MSEEYLILHGAPTLAGLKTGSLFSCRYASREALTRELGTLNRALGKKGLRLLPLRLMAGQRVLLYLYRPARLQADLQCAEAAALLREAGYTDLRQERCLAELMRRLRGCDAFPHEIGLFLSYPPADVRGFIEHRGHDSKLDGCWKVYSDVSRAARLFAAYKSCTDSYLKRAAHGASVAQLAVAG